MSLPNAKMNYHHLFENSKDAIFCLSPAGQLLDLNPAGRRLLGRRRQDGEEATRLQEHLIWPENAWVQLQDQLVADGHVSEFEAVILDRDGDEKDVVVDLTADVDNTGKIRHYLGVIRDITRRNYFQRRLFQEQKMESISRVAGTLAHDFNNILTAILGYSALARDEVDRNSRSFDYLRAIEKATQRGAELTAKLVGFARGGRSDLQVVNINDLIVATLPGITRREDDMTNLKVTLYEAPVLINADPFQLRQLLLNMCSNALNAMPDGGTLRIRTDLLRLDRNQLSNKFGNPPGPYALLEISDTGHGIAPEILEQIYEPFFSSYSNPERTGLGLSMVYGIVKSHSGFIDVESRVGVGTRFRIYMPFSHIPEWDSVTSGNSLAQLPVQQGWETVLVIDDEETVRNLARDLLQSYGYRVILAENARQGIEKYRIYQNELDMVILDMVMPDMNGLDTYQRLKAVRGDIKILIATGHGDSDEIQKTLNEGARGIILKPYLIKAFLRKVRDVLDSD